MNYLHAEKNYHEHRDILVLCNKIDQQLENIEDNQAYYHLQHTIKDLHHLMITVHYPEDRILTTHLKYSHQAGASPGCYLEYQHTASLASQMQLLELIKTARAELLIGQQQIVNQAHNAINGIQRIINLEEGLFTILSVDIGCVRPSKISCGDTRFIDA